MKNIFIYLLILFTCGQAIAQESKIPKKSLPGNSTISKKSNSPTNPTILDSQNVPNQSKKQDLPIPSKKKAISDTTKPISQIPTKDGRPFGSPPIIESDPLKNPKLVLDTTNLSLKKPKAELAFYQFNLETPTDFLEIKSLSKDYQSRALLAYFWKTIPFGNPSIKLIYDSRYPQLTVKIANPGSYHLRHIVKSKEGLLDSVDFTIVLNKKTVDFSPIAKIKIESPGYTINTNQLPLVLRSIAEDPEKQTLTYHWSISPSINGAIDNPSFSSIQINNLKEGKYTVFLEVKDPLGHLALESININVIASIVTSPPVSPDSTIEIVKVKIPRLKGGPEYALLDLLLPGVGHFYVSGDYTGNFKKKSNFITTVTIGAIWLGAVYNKYDSERLYKKYTDLSIEYQQNEFGIKTGGVRGTLAAIVDPTYEKARRRDLTFKGLALTAGVITIGDAIWTFLKGSQNKSEYNRRYKKGKYSIIIRPGIGQANVVVNF